MHIGQISCMFNAHRPDRKSVNWNGFSYEGICKYCGGTIARTRGRKWHRAERIVHDLAKPVRLRPTVSHSRPRPSIKSVRSRAAGNPTPSPPSTVQFSFNCNILPGSTDTGQRDENVLQIGFPRGDINNAPAQRLDAGHNLASVGDILIVGNFELAIAGQRAAPE